jgi:hypothetical protein
MWLSIWGSWNREAGMWVLLLGLVLCLFSGIILIGLLNNKALWLSQDKYNEHIQEFKDAKKIYEKASKQLINRALEIDADKKYTKEDMLKCWNTIHIATQSKNPIFFKDFIETIKTQGNTDKKYTESDLELAIDMAREGIRVTRISEWETEKEFDYTPYNIIEILKKQSK